MDLRQLECFLSVAEHLHFGKAAEALYLGQPTVSESIRRLELEIGGALFERTTRRVSLTPLGVAFLDEARPAYEGVVHAYEHGQGVAREQASEFCVGYTGDIGASLVDVIAELQRQCPGTTVSLRPMPTSRQVRWLRERRLHAGFCLLPPLDPSFETVRLEGARLVAVVPSSHPLAGRESASLADIVHEPLIAWPRSVNPALYDELAAAMDALDQPWTLVGTAVGADTIAARVLSGFGVGLIFESFIETLTLPGISYVPLLDVAVIDRVLMWRSAERHEALDPFVKLVQAHFSVPAG